MTILQFQDQKVTIDQGELVGYVVAGHEFIHQKGSPGWRSSDTEMFPIIGPTAEAHFKVWTPRGDAILDQHGLLREMPYTLKLSSSTIALFQKEYKAGTKVKNSKYPKKSTEKELHWPYDFRFQKQFNLTSEGLEITFTIIGEEGMPFMLGYHPAFKTTNGEAKVQYGDEFETVELWEVKQEGSRALELPRVKEVTLKDAKKLKIATEGFQSFMLWTEVDNMLCIEPITFYPYAVIQERLFQGYQYLGTDPEVFKVMLSPDRPYLNTSGMSDLEILEQTLEMEHENLKGESNQSIEGVEDFVIAAKFDRALENVHRKLGIIKELRHRNNYRLRRKEDWLKWTRNRMQKYGNAHMDSNWQREITDLEGEIRDLRSQQKEQRLDTYYIQEALYLLLEGKIRFFSIFYDENVKKDFLIDVSLISGVLSMRVILNFDYGYSRFDNEQLLTKLHHLGFEESKEEWLLEWPEFKGSDILSVMELLSRIFYEGFYAECLQKPLLLQMN